MKYDISNLKEKIKRMQWWCKFHEDVCLEIILASIFVGAVVITFVFM